MYIRRVVIDVIVCPKQRGQGHSRAGVEWVECLTALMVNALKLFDESLQASVEAEVEEQIQHLHRPVRISRTRTMFMKVLLQYT